MMQCSTRTTALAVTVVLGLASAAAQNRQELHFKVGRKATVSITNPYGPVTVKPTPGKHVIVAATLYSDKVEIDHSHNGKRVAVLSHLLPGATADTGRVVYEVLVPSTAAVSVHANTGPVRVEGINGDVSVESASANIDIRDLSDAHIHIRSLDGPITLTNINDGNVEVTSVGGNVMLNTVNATRLQVSSTGGRINYDGDFGNAGEYVLMSHTGDIEAIAPAYASFDVTARSEHGLVQNDFPLEPTHTSFVVKAGSAFAGTMNKAASSVKLLSFSGKIHLKKR